MNEKTFNCLLYGTIALCFLTLFIVIVSELGRMTIINGIEEDYSLAPIEKQYSTFVNDFSVLYSEKEIKVVTNSMFNKKYCEDVNYYLSDKIVNLNNTKRMIETNCLKYEDKDYFYVILKDDFSVNH